LDWQGAESGQGVVNGRAAGGSPAVWTTNQQSNTAAYHPLNKYNLLQILSFNSRLGLVSTSIL